MKAAPPPTTSEVDWFWGIDPSTKAISFAVYGSHGGVVWQTATREPRIGWPEYLVELGRLADEMIRDTIVMMPPTVVAIEQPVGAHPNPRLVAAWGVVVHAMTRLMPGVLVLTPKPQEWRRQLGMKGNADKNAAIAKARTFSCDSPDHNECEAVLIAIAAHVSYVRGVQL